MTATKIDCDSCTATVEIHVFNAMSRTSFGAFAEGYPDAGQATQYMWWHWTEEYDWGTPPKTGKKSKSCCNKDEKP
jgi:hypothetical protein